MSVYNSILSGYLGFLNSDQQTSIVNQYLAQNDLSQLPANPTVDDLQKFYSYVSTVYTAYMPQQDRSSPEEIKKRQVIFEAFSMALDMISALQNTVRALTQTLTMNSKWQEQYTQMLIKMPVYYQGAPSAMSINSTDFAKSTFGYDNITAQSIFQYGIAQAMQSPNQNIDIPISVYAVGFRFYADTSAGTISVRILDAGDQTGNSLFYPQTTFSAGTKQWAGATPSVSIPANNGQISAAATSLIQLVSASQFNVEITALPPIPGFPRPPLTTQSFTNYVTFNWNNVAGIPWTPGTQTTSTNTTDISAAQSKRAEFNQKIQSFQDTTRSLRQSVRDSATPIQSVLNQAQDGLNKMFSLLSSITDTLKGIISAIHR